MARLRAVRSPAAEGRRREVERHLAATGFAPSTARLREGLESLGPVFASFGRYLGSRADLLPVADCLVLAGIPDLGEAAPPGAVAERIAAELGRPLPELFAGFEEEPFEVRLLHQSHRAWLATGEEATVRVVQPGLEERIELDAGLLALLLPALPALQPAGVFAEALADFRQALADETDCTRQADALEVLARSASPDLPAAAPEVHRRLTSPGVLTVGPLLGEPLAESAFSQTGEEAAAYDLARQVHLFWLRQALTSRKLPLEAGLVRLAGGRLGCTGGTFADVHGGAQANLREYLRATAAQDPERIYACLARDLMPPPGPPIEAHGDLRKRLRQVVPFHEETPSAGRESLIEHLLAHWQLIRRCGHRPRPHLRDFYRGLFWAARTGWLLAPVQDPLRDPLRDALDDLEWRAGWSELQQLADPRRMAEMFEGYLAAMAVLPQQVEQALDRLGRDGGRDGRPSPARTGRRRVRGRSRNSSTAAVALGLAMAATALVTARLAALPGAPGEAVEKLGALIFLLLGALMLWLSRHRPANGHESGKKNSRGL
jgi:hypothetical protein